MRCPDALGLVLLAASCAAPAAAHAAVTQPAPANAPALSTGQVDGPIEVGPSWATAQQAQSAATLQTVLNNYGTVADRLIQVRCPYAGHVGLSNGTLHSDVMAPTPPQEARGTQEIRDAHTQQNGLDLPPASHGEPTPVTARFALTDSRQPLGPGALVPCTINFAHGGQRIVVFTVGEKPDPVSEP
ncbi:MAG: hypothetical protein INR65_05605 [Gluconacetobacter diazotrophicus]|nr:hypothetical protein [Gluconacetobacter diazotrophicus]